MSDSKNSGIEAAVFESLKNLKPPIQPIVPGFTEVKYSVSPNGQHVLAIFDPYEFHMGDAWQFNFALCNNAGKVLKDFRGYATGLGMGDCYWSLNSTYFAVPVFGGYLIWRLADSSYALVRTNGVPHWKARFTDDEVVFQRPIRRILPHTVEYVNSDPARHLWLKLSSLDWLSSNDLEKLKTKIEQEEEVTLP